MALSPAPATSDLDLLAEYVAGSQTAFAELVSRYADLVYSAALRQVRDKHLAEDVTQAVFLLLAQKARRIGRGAILAAWLHRASRYCASNALRMRTNRQRHEQRAAEMKSELISDPGHPQDNSELAAVIDQAIGKLSTVDQQLVILRFFQGKSHQDVAGQCGLSPEAARKRIERALDKLRSTLSGLGLNASTSALSVFLGSGLIEESASGHLITCISTSATSNASLSIAKGALTMMFWTQVKVVALCAVGALVVGAGITAAVVADPPAKPEPKDAKTALIQFADAIKAGDGDYVAKHIEAHNPAQQKLAEAQGKSVTAVSKFKEAYALAFGEAEAKKLPAMVGPTNIPPNIQVTEDGDHAVAVHGMGKVELVRMNGVWKFAIASLSSSGLPISEEQLAAYMQSTSAAMEQVTGNLALNQYKTPVDCVADLQKLTREAAQRQVQMQSSSKPTP